MESQADIAIIGAGFSGLLLCTHLVAQAEGPLHIALCDGSPHRWLGPAYATQRLEHLLNVPAGRMGAFPDAPDDFYRWLQSDAGLAARKHRGDKHIYSEWDFVPRCLYGDYLQSIAARMQEQAKAKQITLSFIDHMVSHVAPAESGYRLSFEGGILTAASVALCCGNPFHPADEREWITQPWQQDFAAIAASKPRSIAILGSGLTAVDTIISLLDTAYGGHIDCYSRNGWLPQPHPRTQASYDISPWLSSLGTPPHSLRMRTLRRAIRQADQSGGHWQAVIDALRPHTVSQWQNYSTPEKKRFLSRYFTLWNIHRHRMAPQLHDRLLHAQSTGQLTIHRITRDAKTAQPWKRADLIFDCTGPRYHTPAPLVASLLAAQLVTPHPTGAGLSADAHGRISPDHAAPIYTIGALLVGEKLETTAVPELRTQTKQLAESLIKEVSPLQARAV